jgi:hypothetical protein
MTYYIITVSISGTHASTVPSKFSAPASRAGSRAIPDSIQIYFLQHCTRWSSNRIKLGGVSYSGAVCLSSGLIFNILLCKQENPHRHVTDTGTKWVTNVLCFFWECFFVLWKSGNEVVFGPTIPISCQSTVQKVLAELRDLHYHQPSSVPSLLVPHFTCCSQQMTTAPSMKQSADKERLKFNTGLKPGSHIFAKVFNVLLLLPQPSLLVGSPIIFPFLTALASAPVPNYLPCLFGAAGQESGSLLSPLFANTFVLLRLDSALFLLLRPTGPSISCSEI